MIQQFRSLMLPVAMLVGFLFSEFFTRWEYLTPYLITAMLFITCCRISISEMRFSRMLVWLLTVQVVGAAALYLLLASLDVVLAEGLMICVLAPTAVAAVVISGLLGADVATIATFTLISNFTVAILAPVFFSFMGTNAGMPFWGSFFSIITRVGPLLILPFIAALALEKVVPKVHALIRKYQILSFYLWTVAMIIVTAKTVTFITGQDASDYRFEVIISAAAFVVCLLQFIAGRLIGRRYGEPISASQSLGQKNTVLAIWMAQTYLSPLASIAPASYVLWQNIINSYQIWRRRNIGRGP